MPSCNEPLRSDARFCRAAAAHEFAGVKIVSLSQSSFNQSKPVAQAVFWPYVDTGVPVVRKNSIAALI